MKNLSRSEALPLSRNSILSPWLDSLCIGGASILLLVPFILFGKTGIFLLGAQGEAVLAMLVNMPHFMASYRLVYRSWENVRRYSWAAIYVPLILLGYVIFALAMTPQTTSFVALFMMVAGIYLAWHYTGQAWGMMAAFFYLDGRSFSALERGLIRGGLRILLVWHVSWFSYYGTDQDWIKQIVERAYWTMTGLTVVAFALGAAGLWLAHRRTGRLPPLQVFIAWLALFVWYGAMAYDVRAIFWVQIAHALQYLIFPFRVEMNRFVRTHRDPVPKLRLHLICYGAGLVVAGLLVERFFPNLGGGIVSSWFGPTAGQMLPVVTLGFINIHHYFTDGCIWKISNPEVRKDLFAHVPAPERKSKPPKPVAV